MKRWRKDTEEDIKGEHDIDGHGKREKHKIRQNTVRNNTIQENTVKEKSNVEERTW